MSPRDDQAPAAKAVALRSPDLPCANCGYSRGGPQTPGSRCPECGASPTPGAPSERWLSAFRSSLTILCWAIPAMLLAWGSPSFLDLGHDPDSLPLVSNSSWLVLAAAAPVLFGLHQLTRCLHPSSATPWLSRLGTAALIAIGLDAAGATSFVVSLCAQLRDGSQAYSYSIWTPLLRVAVTAAAFPAGAVLAAAAQDAGLPRLSARLRRVVWITTITAFTFTLWGSQGRRLLGDDWTTPEPDGSWNLASRLVQFSFEGASQAAAVAIIALALVAWHVAAQTRAQVVCASAHPSPPGAP